MRRLALALALLLAASPAWGAAPIILYTDITSGPDTGGEDNNGCYLSIFGFNFGSNIDNVSVTVGGGAVARKIFLGTSMGRPDVQQLSVQLGADAATGAIVVSVGGLSSNNDHTFTVRAGDIYFISHSGNDSGGTIGDIADPFRTGTGVWNRADFGAGDFIVIINDEVYDFASGNEGLYTGWGNGTWINTTKSGTEDSPITIYGYPGASAPEFKFELDNQYVVKTANSTTTSWITVANLKADVNNTKSQSLYYGFYSSSTNKLNYARIVNYWVYNCVPNWSGSSGLSCISLQNVDDLKMYGVQCGPQSSVNDATNGAHIIYQSHRYNNADAGWLYIHDFPHTRGAYQLAGDAWATPRENSWGTNRNVRVHDSLFKNLAREAILMNLGSFEIYIYNNIINEALTDGSDGFSPIAFRGAELNQGQYHLYNNTIYTDAPSTTGGGVIQMGYSPGSTYPESVEMKNNIIYTKSAGNNYYQINHSSFTTDKITADYNIWYGSSDDMPTWEGAHGASVDPLFTDLANDVFTLQASSPAIGAGVDLSGTFTTDYVSTPRGTIFDIGAYEYQAGSYLGFGLGGGGSMAIGSGGAITLQ